MNLYSLTGVLLMIVVRTQDIDSEVAQHLKRLSRKDPTTKVICVYLSVVFPLPRNKALHEEISR